MSGMYGEPIKGADVTLVNPKFLRPPTNGLAVQELASENPQNIHWNVVIAATIRDWKSMERADFLRARPPYSNPTPGIISHTRNPQTTKYT